MLDLHQDDGITYTNVHLDAKYACDGCGAIVEDFTDTQYAMDATTNRLYIVHDAHAAMLDAPIQALLREWNPA